MKQLLTLLFGSQHEPAYDLRKKPSFNVRFWRWVGRNIHIILPIVIVLGMALFLLGCFAVCGGGATESGRVYNGMSQVI